MKGLKLFILLLTTSGVVFCANRIEAIPAFARKYGTSCSTCHVVIPKLNAFGKAFRLNGYRFPKEALEQLAEKPVPLGGEPQKKLHPKKAIYPGAIPGTVPLAIRLESDVNINPASVVKSDFRLPHEVEILSGGNLGESISFFVYFQLYNDGELGGLKFAFFQFDSPFGNNPIFNMRMGQIEPAVVPFTRYRRITMEDYLTSRIQNGPNSFNFKQPQRGLEVWGIRDGSGSGGLFYAMGLVNGNGASGKGDAGTLDNNSSKDFYGRLRYKFGGLSLTGEKGPPPQGGSWMDNSLSLGGYGYRGWSPESSFHRLGVDVQWQYKNLDLFGTYMWGEDSFSLTDTSVNRRARFTAFFVQADYVILPWIVAALRYSERRTPDDPAAPDVKEILAHLSFSVRPNVVLRMESVGTINRAEKTRARVRIDFAF
ncbi:MAG: hypothetical protein ACE5IR_15150 [bacterium]